MSKHYNQNIIRIYVTMIRNILFYDELIYKYTEQTDIQSYIECVCEFYVKEEMLM